MEFAIWDTFHPRTGVAITQHYDQLFKEIALAEESGFQHYWFLEHHLNQNCPMPSPNLVIAAASRSTHRIRLGNMVNILPFRNPVILAEEIAMLDNLTGGRVDVGIGRGQNPREFHTFGLAHAASREMFLEAIKVMEAVWNQETFDFAGKYFQVNKTTAMGPPPVQKPLPLFVSGQSEESLRWAAERNISFGQIDALPDECRRDCEFYRSVQVASGHAPSPKLFLTREIFVGETDAEARRDAYAYLLKYWDLWGRYAQFVRERRIPESDAHWRRRAPRLAAMSYDDLIENDLIFIGSPATVQDKIRKLAANLDVAVLACVFHLGGLEHEKVCRSMQLFAQEVMPNVMPTHDRRVHVSQRVG
jgi:alkanesulfonate monooxygenase SsuD/methylene tetrahydromethanopterin reductase-like flavin-dependent oxidoreductase (luciferase family)